MTDIIARALALKAQNKAKFVEDILSTFPTGLTYKGAVDYFDLLPAVADIGFTQTIKYSGTSAEAGTNIDGREFTWDGNEWVCISPIAKHETWTFTLLDGSVVAKEVASWTSTV